jgi:alkyl sulfatase BDS1-like metallo-beta-lactamase superfamily hydrolase
VDYIRVRLDPKKSGETDMVLQFDFQKGASAGLHVRRAIAEFIEAPGEYLREPDILMELSEEAWAKVYLSAEPIRDLIQNGEIKVTKGDAREALRILELFDRYDPAKAVVVTPTIRQDHM